MLRCPRVLGLVPLALFAGQALVEFTAGTPTNLLWACHLSNLCLGLGLLAGWPRLARAAALVLLPGLLLWGVELLAVGSTTPMSVASHLGGVGVAGLALWRLGLDRHAWWLAFVGLVVLQELCRWITPPALNVNLAFAVHSSSVGLFSSFAVYRGLVLLAAFGALAGLSALLRRRLRPAVTGPETPG